MRITIMTSAIILCFALTILSVFTINSMSSLKAEEQTALEHAVDSAIDAIEKDNAINSDNYEKMVNNILQLVILQSNASGKLNIKILDANTEEGLLNIEVSKTYKWYNKTKTVTTQRTIILEEYDMPTATAVEAVFVYKDANNEELVWRDDTTFVGAILRRPKNPKKSGHTFTGWSTQSETGEVISNDEWQNYVIPEITTTPKRIVFYAVFTPNT